MRVFGRRYMFKSLPKEKPIETDPVTLGYELPVSRTVTLRGTCSGCGCAVVQDEQTFIPPGGGCISGLTICRTCDLPIVLEPRDPLQPAVPDAQRVRR